MVKNFCDKCGAEVVGQTSSVRIPTRKMGNLSFETASVNVCPACLAKYEGIIEALIDIRFAMFKDLWHGDGKPERERLADLIRNAPKISFPVGSRAQGRTYQTTTSIADHLLANGVRFGTMEMISSSATADVVEVVRCKDCALRYTGDCASMQEDDTDMYFRLCDDDDFCSSGVRKE